MEVGCLRVVNLKNGNCSVLVPSSKARSPVRSVVAPFVSRCPLLLRSSRPLPDSNKNSYCRLHDANRKK